MRTLSKSYPNNSNATIPSRSNRRRVPNIAEPEIYTIEEVVPMADRTMEELLQAPTEGDVPDDAIKLMFFPYSLEGAARIWYEKEPPNSILTWDDLVNKFFNQFSPPSKTTHLKNEISQFKQRFEETFGEAWERFKEMLRACPYHGFSKLTQIDTFYNGLNEQDQDSLNATTGGNLLSKMTREALKIIKNKSKVRYSRSKSNVSRVNTNSRDSSSKTDDRIDKLADQILNLVEIVNKQVIAPATAKVVEKTCVICGGAHAYYDCIDTDSNQPSVCAATGTYNQVSPPNRASNQIPPTGFALASTSGTLSSNNVPNPKGEMKAVTTRSGLAYEGPSIPIHYPLEKVVERDTKETTDKEHSNSQGSTPHIQPPVVPISILELDVLKTQPKPNIPYPSRLNDQKLCEKATNQMEKFFQIFHDFHFDISFVDTLVLMPKIASTIKSLLTNKDKLFELAKVALNENCSAMLLKKLPEKLGDPNKFLIPCDFPGIDAEETKAKSSIEEPPELELKELPTHLEYAFLEDTDKKLNDATRKDHFSLPFMDQILERSAGNEFYCFLDGFLGYLQISIDPQDQDKTTFACPYGTFAYCRMPFGLCNAPGHKILKSGIKVDRDKVDVIAKLPHPTTIKGVRSFLGHAGFYRRFIQDFSKIARPMTNLLEKETPFVFSKECVDAFDTLNKNLTEVPILVVPD
nr:reverse transcriptase domain-containing protein [Tanacetum cinerariifolium]